MISVPKEMDKYIIIGKDKPILKKEAPEEYKKIAEEINESKKKYTGEVYFEIEE